MIFCNFQAQCPPLISQAQLEQQQQETEKLKESTQTLFFGLRDHLWLKGPIWGQRKL
jgi:hypothetical protein